MRQIQAAGVSSLQNIANALNDRGVRTARGGAWDNSTVRNLLARGCYNPDSGCRQAGLGSRSSNSPTSSARGCGHLAVKLRTARVLPSSFPRHVGP